MHGMLKIFRYYINIHATNLENVIDMIILFIGDNLLRLMIEETNILCIDKFKYFKKALKWKDVKKISVILIEKVEKRLKTQKQ